MSAIHLLPVSLLDEHRPLVNELRLLARSLGLEFGWHYLLDLVWMIDQLGSHLGTLKGNQYDPVPSILDAGAGTGVMQWYLAEHGAEVLSVDRAGREGIPLHFRFRYRIRGLRKQDLARPSISAYIRYLAKAARNSLSQGTALQYPAPQFPAPWRRAPGRVIIYNQNLERLTEIADASLDAVVSVSALEHNPPEQLGQVIHELMRALKPGGVLLATLGAARSQDWYHKPSSGWCYTEASLLRLFELAPETFSNFADYNALFSALRECGELRDNLAKFYFRSANNGMPWGVWDPQYQPVGVLKIKT